LQARVLVSQPLGAETILDLDCGGIEMVARVDAQNRVASGDIVDLHLRMERSQLFDPSTGENLTARIGKDA
jgi:multiple sugar transport system ATP-binding protein